MRLSFVSFAVLPLAFFVLPRELPAAAQQRHPPVIVMSYNVENLFSPRTDSLNPDEDFTPLGEKRWTHKRLRAKLVRIADAIVSASEAHVPAIVGLCEVEDAYVLWLLTRKTYLEKVGYWFYHRDSPDPRGIDVAVLYDTAQLFGLGCRWLRPRPPGGNVWESREILYARFRLPDGDTLHLFQNHWPSKYSGAQVSETKRLAAMRGLMAAVDSIAARSPQAKIIAMGDFNEDAGNAIFSAMSSPDCATAREKHLLVNLLHPQRKRQGPRGSHKYNGRWAMIDNFFVSPSLIDGKGYRIDAVKILAPQFLLEPDAPRGGVRPRRSYLGPRFNAMGTSDHLPIVLKLKIPTFVQSATDKK